MIIKRDKCFDYKCPIDKGPCQGPLCAVWTKHKPEPHVLCVKKEDVPMHKRWKWFLFIPYKSTKWSEEVHTKDWMRRMLSDKNIDGEPRMVYPHIDWHHSPYELDIWYHLNSEVDCGVCGLSHKQKGDK